MAIALVSRTGWGHTFPPVHTVVVQVEPCEVVLLIGYSAGTGEPAERILARVASQPSSHAIGALRDTLAAYALAPLTLTVDGKPQRPLAVRAKLGADRDRPLVIVLATFALGDGERVTISSKDPRTTRISWQDRASGRITAERAPTQNRWFTGVASFLLPLAPATGGSACSTTDHATRSR